MHSCCCICFIIWCGFGVYLIWIQNLFLNGFGNKFKWEKKRKRKKRKPYLLISGLEAQPRRPTSSLSRWWAVGAELASPFLSRARVGRPGKPLLPHASLPCFADEQTPLSAAPSSSSCHGRARDRRCPQPNQPSISGFPTRKRHTRSINV
jgi:hypothetical protein